MLANGLPIWALPLTCFVSFADYLDSCALSVKQKSGQEDVCFHSDAVLWFLPPLQPLYHLSQFWFWKRISVTFTIWSFLPTHWEGFSVLPWSIRVLGVAAAAAAAKLLGLPIPPLRFLGRFFLESSHFLYFFIFLQAPLCSYVNS